MPAFEIISAFAISIAANIATNLLSHRSTKIVKEIKNAYEEALKQSFSEEIRQSSSFERKKRDIEYHITQQIYNEAQLNELKSEYRTVLNNFKQAIANRQNAYNYLKDITDSMRYEQEFRMLEELHRGVADTNERLDRLELWPFINKEEFLARYPLKGKFLRNEYIDSVINKLKTPENRVIRFIALSGMGKTRIVREAFSDTDSELYYCESLQDAKSISVLRTIFTHSPADSIVILDNCSVRVFGQILSLKDECGAEQRIISIGNDMQESQQQGVELIRLQTHDLQEMVDDYIAGRLGCKENENYDRITEFAEGIPYMAILLCDALDRNGKPGYIDNETIFYKLLGIDQNNPNDADDANVLKACSLFMPLGYSGQYSRQSDFVATCSYLTNLQGSDIKQKRKFKKVCNKYIERQLIEHISGHINIRPLPLAIWLASEWFKECIKEDILSLINDISAIQSEKHDHAKYMQEAFCRRLEYMTENRVAKEVLTELIQPGGPFAHEEILNTSMGSRLLLSFANVIPDIVANTLYDIYANYDLDKLKSNLADDARRNFVYLLEKICYSKKCFHKATMVVARLALAENETWSNNSIGLFRQLFHILIPGTEASLDDRFGVIQACRLLGNEYIDLILTAIDSGLSVDGFMLTKGAERQGFAVYQNYQPTYREVFDYWQKCHDMLIEITEEYPSKLQQITSIVEKHSYDLLKVDRMDMLYRLLDYYVPLREYDWDEMLKTLNRISDNPELYNFDKTKLDNYIKHLTRTDFHSRFIAIRERENRKFRRPYKETICAINQQYEKSAEEYVNDHWNNIGLLQKFYANDFSCAAAFAGKVCELEKDSGKKRDFFIEQSIEILKEKPNSKGKAFLVYYCASIENREYLENVITRISEAGTYPVLFAIIGACFPKLDGHFYKDMLTLIADEHVDANNINEFLNYLRLSSGQSLLGIYKDISALGTKAQIAILNKVKWIARSNDFNGSSEFVMFVEQYIIELLTEKDVRTLYFSDIMEIAKTYLSINDNPKFAVYVHSEVLNFLNTKYNFNAESIYITLLYKYKDTIWPALSSALLAGAEHGVTYSQLRFILGSHIGFQSGLLINNYGEDFLLRWCKDNAPIAPQRLASIIPVYRSDGSKRFSDIMLKLLDLFGNDEEVLSNLSCNMGSFAWTGSVIPLFQTQLAALHELENHKHYTVIRWAKELIEYTEQTIKKETDREAFERLIRH